MKKKPLITVAGCIAVGLLTTLVVPQLRKYDDHFPAAFDDYVLHERIGKYPTAHSAPKPGDGEAILALPPWVPQDATDVKIKAQTTGNAKLMRFRLGKSPLKPGREADCAGGAFSDAPALDADWWPRDAGEGAGRPECSGTYQFRVVVKGDHAYAWTDGDRAGG